MSQWFEFSPVDEARRILRFKLKGFWHGGVMSRFEETFQSQINELAALGGGFCVLVDLSEYPSQNQEVQAGHMRCMGYAIDHGMIRSAHLVDSALTDVQMRRMTQQVDPTRFAHFRTEEEALAWLLEGSRREDRTP